MTNAILVAAGFISIAIGVFFHRKRNFLIACIAVAVVLLVAPFVRYWSLTRDAYDWTIVVERDLGTVENPRGIFVDRIEWITDYERLKRQRGHVGSLPLNSETIRKVWHVKGYIPVEIRVVMLIGSDTVGITRMLSDLPPGEYTFTLTIDPQDVPHWDYQPSGP